MRLLALCSLALAVLTACPGATGLTRCKGRVDHEIEGQLQGSFSVCNTLEQRYLKNLDEYLFTGAYTELPTSFTLLTEWELRGAPTERRYTQDQIQVECKVNVKRGRLSWLARKGAGAPLSGTCQLTLDEVVELPSEGNVVNYQTKGRITALLEAEPNTGSSGNVAVDMEFCQGDATFCPEPVAPSPPPPDAGP